jgi:hypothetical protein
VSTVKFYDSGDVLLLEALEENIATISAEVLAAAKTVDASGCTALTDWCEKYQIPNGRMEAFLTGGGRAMADVCSPEHWNCHDWRNCPTHAAYGAYSINGVPAKWRSEAAGLLTAPSVVLEAKQ